MIFLFQDSLRYIPEDITTTDSILKSEDLFVLLQKLLIAILIGALIGIEREHSKTEGEKTFAGIRTFPLISILGFIAALISSLISFWIYLAIFGGFASLITASHIYSAREGRFGGTSEISMLVVFMLGSLVLWNFIILAAIIGVIVTLFLTLKIQLHTFAGKINEEDLYATLKLAIITVIILPLLPDKTYGPFNVLNPRAIWYMVIFISGISFIGYILIKIYGQDKGIFVTGLLGGMVSSTAVAVSLSRKSNENKELAGNLAVGIILASTVMYPRIFIVALVFNSSLILKLWIPMLIFTLTGIGISYFMSKKVTNIKHEKIEVKNPFELKSALLFGLIFGLVMFAAKAAQVYLGNAGVYSASGLAGITSVDAIVLSLAKLPDLNKDVAIVAIIIATISNTIVKGVVSNILGVKELKRYTLTGLGIICSISIAYLLVTWFFI